LPLNVSIADENDSDLRYSEVPPKGKNKTLVKNIGGSSTQDDPWRSNIGGRDPYNPCGVDAYGCTAEGPRDALLTAYV